MTQRLIITGFSGFVAPHFIDFLYNNDSNFDVYGISSKKPIFNYDKYMDRLNITFFKLSLMEKDKLHELISQIKPNFILHLAALSSVAYSWTHPEESFINNCNIFLNLIDAVKKTIPSCRILSVGSSEEYGNVMHDDLPLEEKQILRPNSPYAVARVAQEQLSKVYADSFGMQIIMTRSFNHIGPRQDNRFVVPSLIKKVLTIKSTGKKRGEIETGDLSIVRDFVDVRDVCKAYYLLLTGGTVGEVYNVCSGRPVKLADLLDMIANEVGMRVTYRVNPTYIRPNDSKEIVGSHHKIETELGWKASIPLARSIGDMLKTQLLHN